MTKILGLRPPRVDLSLLGHLADISGHTRCFPSARSQQLDEISSLHRRSPRVPSPPSPAYRTRDVAPVHTQSTFLVTHSHPNSQNRFSYRIDGACTVGEAGSSRGVIGAYRTGTRGPRVVKMTTWGASRASVEATEVASRAVPSAAVTHGSATAAAAPGEHARRLLRTDS